MPRHSLSRFVLQHVAAALIVASATGLARAQTSGGADTILGQRYFEAAFGASTYQGSSQAALHGGAALQIPVVAHLDADVGYSRSDWRPKFLNGLFALHTQTDAASAGLTTYTQIANVRAFAGAGLVREWQHETISYAGSSVYDARAHTSTWDVDAGAEVVVRRIVITPSLGYAHQIHEVPYGPRDRGVLVYALEVHRWFTARIGGFAEAEYGDPQSQTAVGGWSYTAGVRTRF